MTQDKCDAVDINLGCPQRIAHSGNFGSYLLRDEEHAKVFSMVEALSKHITVPVFCKIRLLERIEDTIAFCQKVKEPPNHKANSSPKTLILIEAQRVRMQTHCGAWSIPHLAHQRWSRQPWLRDS